MSSLHISALENPACLTDQALFPSVFSSSGTYSIDYSSVDLPDKHMIPFSPTGTASCYVECTVWFFFLGPDEQVAMSSYCYINLAVRWNNHKAFLICLWFGWVPTEEQPRLIVKNSVQLCHDSLIQAAGYKARCMTHPSIARISYFFQVKWTWPKPRDTWILLLKQRPN